MPGARPTSTRAAGIEEKSPEVGTSGQIVGVFGAQPYMERLHYLNAQRLPMFQSTQRFPGALTAARHGRARVTLGRSRGAASTFACSAAATNAALASSAVPEPSSAARTAICARIWSFLPLYCGGHW